MYWTPETERKVLSGLQLRNDKRDAMLLKSLMRLDASGINLWK